MNPKKVYSKTVNVVLDFQLHCARLIGLFELFFQFVLPHLQELVELVCLGAKRDPILFGIFTYAILELFVNAPHGLDLRDVRVYFEKLFELRRLKLKVSTFFSSIRSSI